MNKKILFSALIALALVFSSNSYAKQSHTYNNKVDSNLISFSEAKRELTKIYNANRDPVNGFTEASQTFYCHCPIVREKVKHSTKTKLVPNLDACGYVSGKYHKRAERIEWEHIMPAAWKGRDLRCWQTGGRKNCQGDPEFVKFEGDMHNLVPSVGEINATRGQFRYTDFQNKKKSPYGQCFFLVDTKAKAVEPARYTRGFIARTFLYMSETHHVELSSKDKKMMIDWNKKNPPTVWECYRNERIALLSGRDNRFITQACKKQPSQKQTTTKSTKNKRNR